MIMAVLLAKGDGQTAPLVIIVKGTLIRMSFRATFDCCFDSPGRSVDPALYLEAQLTKTHSLVKGKEG